MIVLPFVILPFVILPFELEPEKEWIKEKNEKFPQEVRNKVYPF